MPVTMTPQMKTVKNPQAKATAPPRTPVLRGGNGSCRHTEISERRRARTRPNAATWKASVHVEPRTRAATNRTGETVASTTRAPLPWIEDAGTIHSSLNATRPHLPQIPCSSPAAYCTVIFWLELHPFAKRAIIDIPQNRKTSRKYLQRVDFISVSLLSRHVILIPCPIPFAR